MFTIERAFNDDIMYLRNESEHRTEVAVPCTVTVESSTLVFQSTIQLGQRTLAVHDGGKSLHTQVRRSVRRTALKYAPVECFALDVQISAADVMQRVVIRHYSGIRVLKEPFCH